MTMNSRPKCRQRVWTQWRSHWGGGGGGGEAPPHLCVCGGGVCGGGVGGGGY